MLCYHAISSSWGSELAVPVDRFAAQIEWFARRDYVGLTFAEAERRRTSGTLPRRTLVVTFDDAFLSILQARAVLAGFGFPATVFVVGAFLDGQRLLEWSGITEWLEGEHRDELRCIPEQGLRELQDEGWEIGSHTMTHPLLTSLDAQSLQEELVASRALLAERFGGCETIAYPYGFADGRVGEAAAAAGYLAGCTLTPSLRRDEPRLRPRVGVSGHDSPFRAWGKMSPAGRWIRRTLPESMLERL